MAIFRGVNNIHIKVITDDGTYFSSMDEYPKIKTLKDGVWYDEDGQPLNDDLNILSETLQKLTG